MKLNDHFQSKLEHSKLKTLKKIEKLKKKKRKKNFFSGISHLFLIRISLFTAKNLKNEKKKFLKFIKQFQSKLVKIQPLKKYFQPKNSEKKMQIVYFPKPIIWESFKK